MHDLIRKIKNLTVSKSASGLLYNSACSQIKAITLENFKTATFTEGSIKKLLDLNNVRIFDTLHKVKNLKTISKCALTKAVVGKYSALQAKKQNLNKVKDTYAGNWAMFINKKKTGPKYMTVCGFFDCARDDSENLVKHMNLCKYTSEKYKGSYSYLFSGTFILADNKCIINVRSGSWAIAKILLRTLNIIKGSDKDDEIDAIVTEFAETHIKKILML